MKQENNEWLMGAPPHVGDPLALRRCELAGTSRTAIATLAFRFRISLPLLRGSIL